MRGFRQLVVLMVAALLPAQLIIAQAVPATGPNVAAVNQEPAQAPGEVEGRLPRLIIVTQSSSQVFSGTFKGQETTATNDTSPPPLQLQYAGPTTGVQVFTYNETAVTVPLSDAQVQWSPFDDTDNLSPQAAQVQKGRAFCRQLLIENPMLKLCEPDQQVELNKASQMPDDPLNPQQWALKAIDMEGAWNKSAFGSSGVRVCMVDTGLDYYHPDLLPNLWTNKREIPGDGIDNDMNGIVDDVYGANFVTGGTSGDPYDDNGHGTFVAGVVGAVGNNNVGTTGVSQNADIIGCKFMDAGGNGWISDAIRCWDYCTRQDAHLVSNSWGVYSTSAALQQAAAALNARGVLLMASAGNSARDTDKVAHVPSTLTEPNVIAVGAIQSDGTVWPGSNTGLKSVDFAAPGVRVLGLGVGGSYISMTGTSMATPHVTGVAAIVLAKFLMRGYGISTKYPSVGLAAQLKNILIESSYKLPGNKVTLYGGLNATAAVSLVPGGVWRRRSTPKPTSMPTAVPPIAAEGVEDPSAAMGPTVMVEAPGVEADASGPAAGCDCSCAAEPAASPPPGTLPDGLAISSTGTVVAVSPAVAPSLAESPESGPEAAPAPASARKLMGSRRHAK